MMKIRDDALRQFKRTKADAHLNLAIKKKSYFDYIYFRIKAYVGKSKNQTLSEHLYDVGKY